MLNISCNYGEIKYLTNYGFSNETKCDLNDKYDINVQKECFNNEAEKKTTIVSKVC